MDRTSSEFDKRDTEKTKKIANRDDFDVNVPGSRYCCVSIFFIQYQPHKGYTGMPEGGGENAFDTYKISIFLNINISTYRTSIFRISIFRCFHVSNIEYRYSEYFDLSNIEYRNFGCRTSIFRCIEYRHF